MQNTATVKHLRIICICYIIKYYRYYNTDLRIENGNVDVIVTDQRSQPVPDVRHLQQYGLHHMIVGYQFLSPGPVYDVGRPSQRDPVIGHGRLFFHHFQYLLFAIHHQTYVRHYFFFFVFSIFKLYIILRISSWINVYLFCFFLLLLGLAREIFPFQIISYLTSCKYPCICHMN